MGTGQQGVMAFNNVTMFSDRATHTPAHPHLCLLTVLLYMTIFGIYNLSTLEHMHLFYKLPSGAFDYESMFVLSSVHKNSLPWTARPLCKCCEEKHKQMHTCLSTYVRTLFIVSTPDKGRVSTCVMAMMPCSTNIKSCSNVIELKFQLDTFVFLVYNYTYSRQPLSYYFVISFFSQSISDNMILVLGFCWN